MTTNVAYCVERTHVAGYACFRQFFEDDNFLLIQLLKADSCCSNL